jgi:hypothetical protein
MKAEDNPMSGGGEAGWAERRMPLLLSHAPARAGSPLPPLPSSLRAVLLPRGPGRSAVRPAVRGGALYMCA